MPFGPAADGAGSTSQTSGKMIMTIVVRLLSFNFLSP